MLRLHRQHAVSRRTHRGFEERMKLLAYWDAQRDISLAAREEKLRPSFGKRDPIAGNNACAASCGHPACAQGCTLLGRFD